MHAFNSGCNVIGHIKDGKKYAMVCAWSTMIDYESIGMLIGGQSLTGKTLKIGDKVGVCALAQGQKDIALKLGENHSDDQAKFEGISFSIKDEMLFVEGAKTQMECEVIKMMKIADPDDTFVVLKVINGKSDKSKKFLALDDVYPEE